ncbi:hypothetical protein Poli38472_002828 [Pythium oligandrum]|uniref:BED-type domain-containing protein n=1 Tax=Pythium oligandrum TaxID=41045 RepID=A0A8K1C5Z0_PYTOL|nr:hypothetical protein Poli38472_002828 [Pythium oligandrum]|eukprot:TMW56903.1 hypothetical protein Poli38472_002828 [Pythium oligandrum]
MVKPLNKEWELFGRKYRVPGAKGEKVDCNACHKQVSAAVNRLQSHLRVCPARPPLPVSLAAQIHGAHSGSASDLDDGGAGAAGLVDGTDAMGDATDLGDPSLDHSSALGVATAGMLAGTPGTAVTTTAHGLPMAKRQKTSPSRSRDRLRWNTAVDDFWLMNASPPPTAAYAKKRLDIEEKRLQLELKRDQREERRERLQLEVLEAQARKERLAAEKEAYEARVLLALSRKQLRDQGVSDEEIDRVLPIEPLGGTASGVDGADATSEADAGDENSHAAHTMSNTLVDEKNATETNI